MSAGGRPAVAVRPAAEGDLPEIARIFGDAFEDYRLGFGVDAPALAALWWDSLAARIPATTVATLPDGAVAGFVVTVKPGAKEAYGRARRAWWRRLGGRGGRGPGDHAPGDHSPGDQSREGLPGGAPRGQGEVSWWRTVGLRSMWRPPALFLPMGLAYARRRQAKDELYVSLLAVDPALQGRGIGQALLRAVEGEARAAGAAAILLHTGSTNTRARAAYARAGYELVCTVRTVWPGPAGIPAYVALRRPLRPDPAPRIAALTHDGL